MINSQVVKIKPRAEKGLARHILCSILDKIISTPKYSKIYKIDKNSLFKLSAGDIGTRKDFNINKLSKYYEGLGFKEYDIEKNEYRSKTRNFKQTIGNFLNNCSKRNNKKEEKVYDFGELQDISDKVKKTKDIKLKKADFTSLKDISDKVKKTKDIKPKKKEEKLKFKLNSKELTQEVYENLYQKIIYKGQKNNVYIEFYVEKRNNLYMSLFKSQQDRSKPRVKKGMPYLILCSILRKIISTPEYSKPFKINKYSDFTLTAGNIGIPNFNLEKLSKYYESLGFKEYDKEQNDEPESMRFFKQPIYKFLKICSEKFIHSFSIHPKYVFK